MHIYYIYTSSTKFWKTFINLSHIYVNWKKYNTPQFFLTFSKCVICWWFTNWKLSRQKCEINSNRLVCYEAPACFIWARENKAGLQPRDWWEREGILGLWPGCVNFLEVAIKRRSNYCASANFNWLSETSSRSRATNSKQKMQNIVMATVEFSLLNKRLRSFPETNFRLISSV